MASLEQDNDNITHGQPHDCRGASHGECGCGRKPSGDALAHFDSMIDNCLEYATAMKQQGKGIVGIFCEYTPREIIMAADAVPVCMCGGSDETIPAAEEDLPSNLCPLIKSSYGYAKLKWNPFMEMADLLVAETTCDGKKKMYELLARTKDIHVLELTQKQDSPEALRLWKEEIVKLKNRLEQKFSVRITDDKLRAAIAVMNRERRLRASIAALAAGKPPVLSGSQVLNVKSSISGIERDLAMYEGILSGVTPPRTAANGSRPRVLVTGVPMPHGAEKVMEIIEASGGDVVVQENCTGLKPLVEQVDENKDPLTAIAEKYFHLSCSCMTPNRSRFELIDRLIAQYRPDAVIELVWRACHTYNVEAAFVKEHIEKHGLPYLKLETDYSPSDEAQLKVRVQTVLEMAALRRRPL